MIRFETAREGLRLTSSTLFDTLAVDAGTTEEAEEDMRSSEETRRRPAGNLANGLLVEWLSLAWTIVEAVVAIGAGVHAHSIVLVAFGADSVIEIISAAALLWRLYVEAVGRSLERVEAAERVASWIVGVALLLLALYIVADSALSFLRGHTPEASPAGIAVTAVASIAMPLLAGAKKRIGRRIGSRALEADGSCSMVCAYMAWITLAGVAATALFGVWWIDSIAALGLVYFVAHEGLEAIGVIRE